MQEVICLQQTTILEHSLSLYYSHNKTMLAIVLIRAIHTYTPTSLTHTRGTVHTQPNAWHEYYNTDLHTEHEAHDLLMKDTYIVYTS